VQSPDGLDSERLRDWLVTQRWFASKSRGVSSIELVERLELGDGLVLALAQTRFAAGTHELYQLSLGIDGDEVEFDAITDPPHARALLARIEGGGDLETDEGRFSFRCLGTAPAADAETTVRPMGVEQSNSSVVFGERLVLKVFRKLEPGINPELEILRFLTAHGFPNIAPLHGWYEYEGTALAATLGVVQEFVPQAADGWTLALGQIVTEPEIFLERIGELGAATAQMHSALASDAGDPAFSPEEPSHEAISLLTATIDEDIERMFLRLDPDDERLAPIVGRGEDVRERLAARAQIGIGGRHIRIHGDYHLGQTLYTPRGWVILDFEGEPARPLPERRQKRSPLRDVASMLRSFAYVSSAVTLLRGEHAPDDFEGRARVRFLERYFEEVDPTLLPAGDSAVSNMLAIFELEKAIYELQYELDNRPDWVSIPVAGIVRLLERT
jgi:trehalose synthase-fused probable maltokinase